MTLWGEAGEAINYLKRRTDIGKLTPDYRGGLAYAKGFGRLIGSRRTGLFAETNDDAVFISRFDDDFLIYSQNRVGVTLRPVESAGSFQAQFYWNLNATRRFQAAALGQLH